MYTIKSVLACVIAKCIFFSVTSSLMAQPLPPHVFIIQGGYSFETSVELRDPSSREGLVVELRAERETRAAMCVNGPIFPTAFAIYAYCPVKGKIRSVTTFVPHRKEKNCFLKTDVPASSKWRQVLINLVKHAACVYGVADAVDIPKLPKQHTPGRSSLRSIQIRPLHSCTLQTTDAVCNSSLPHSRYSPFPRRVLVEVFISSTLDKKGRNAIAAVAKFYTKESATSDDARSVLQFLQTKDGLKLTSMLHIKRSSIWYPGVKEVVRRGIKKYLRFKQIHKRKFRSLSMKKNISKDHSISFEKQAMFTVG